MKSEHNKNKLLFNIKSQKIVLNLAFDKYLQHNQHIHKKL